MWRSPAMPSDGSEDSLWLPRSGGDSSGVPSPQTQPYSMADLRLPAVTGPASESTHILNQAPYMKPSNAEKVSISQIRRHEQSLEASRKRMNSDLRQLMITYHQQRAQVVKDLHHMRKEIRHLPQQVSPQSRNTISGVKSLPSLDSQDMQYLKSPYHYDKVKSKKATSDNHDEDNSQVKHGVPPLVINDKRHAKQPGDTSRTGRSKVTRLPVLPNNMSSEHTASPSRKTGHLNTHVHERTKAEYTSHQLTSKPTSIDNKQLSYHLPSLDSSAEQEVVLDKNALNYSPRTRKPRHKRHRTVPNPQPSMLPPLLENAPIQTSRNYTRDNLNAKTHLVGQQILPASDTDTSTPKSTPSTGSKKRAIMKVKRRQSFSGASSSTNATEASSTVPSLEKKNVRFAPDVIDYNRESKPSYKRHHHTSHPMRVMELVVHCNNNEPLELPNVVEKYMLRSVPKVNV